MQCNKCGNELHIDAEACWRCGSHTESGRVRKQDTCPATRDDAQRMRLVQGAEEVLERLLGLNLERADGIL